MSLYNLLFGFNPSSALLLKLLKLDPQSIPRFRDCYIQDDCIVVYTRTGGGNRDDYEEGNDSLAAHPQYLRDEDDSFDSTYAHFYFSFPEEVAEQLKQLGAQHPSLTPEEKWSRLFEQMK